MAARTSGRAPTKKDLVRTAQMLDRLRENAMAARDKSCWARYEGALCAITGMGYTVRTLGERTHEISGPIRREE